MHPDEMSKEEVLDELRARLIDRVEVIYSGGGDSGGADSIRLFRAEEEVGNLDQWDGRSADAVLAGALCGPLYETWGSFADGGGYHVGGHLIWDVAKGEVVLSGTETMTEYGPYNEEKEEYESENTTDKQFQTKLYPERDNDWGPYQGYEN